MTIRVRNKKLGDFIPGQEVTSESVGEALDQFLEHLIETDISKIVRLGGRSQSTVLAERNLFSLLLTEKSSPSLRQEFGRERNEPIEEKIKTVICVADTQD